jgi:CSLREA domain-containing protein
MKRLLSVVTLPVSMALIGLSAWPGPLPAYAAVLFDVNTLTDEAQINPPNGSCTHTVSGLCTLRAAIQAANFLGNSPAGCPCTINLPLAGMYRFTIAGTGENLAATGDLDVAASVTLVNASGGAITISGNGLDKVFHVQNTGQLTLSQVTIVRGNGGGNDGVGLLIDFGGTLVMSNAVIAGNVAAGTNAGGGFRNNGTATLTNVTIRDNIAGGNGGGIRNGGELTLTNVAVINNQAQGAGGGITLGGTATLTNVTISGNSTTGPAAEGGGLGAFANATATLTNLTISNNSAPAGTGGGIFARSTATVTLRNTIVANSPSGGNCAGPGTITSVSTSA